MISSKFLHDDGEEDEVFIDEWASSGGISIKHLIQLEKEFLQAIVSFIKKLYQLFINIYSIIELGNICL